MNTRFSMLLPGVGIEQGEVIADEIGSDLAHDERVMSRFEPAAELASVNRLEPGQRMRLGDRLFEILLACRSHWERTGGAFDVTLGAINDNWKNACDAPAPGGWEHVDLDRAGRTIAFAEKGIRIDLGAIGKGLALVGVAERLRSAGLAHAFVSFGESSIMVLGAQPSGEPWQVGICDPFDRTVSVHSFALCDGSISTSGVDPAKPQLIDPRERRAARGRRLLSVACACPVEAEVLSTALIVRSAGEREAILANYPGARAVEFQSRDIDDVTIQEKVWSHAH